MKKSGYLSDRVKKYRKASLAFARRGHSFPFSYYPDSEIVFWPGCGLAGTSPEIVEKTAAILSKNLNKKIGVALDCCFDPVYQAGNADETAKASLRIKGKLDKKRIKEVITGCTNCRKIFSIYTPDMDVKHIMDVLPQNALNADLSILQNYDKVYLHHPCPSSRFTEIRRRAKRLLPEKIEIKESKHPLCCGLGGGADALSPDLSAGLTEKIIDDSEKLPIITYCMGCKNRFLKCGAQAYHILELLPGIKPKDRPASAAEKWLNRLELSLYMRLKALYS